MIPPSQVASKQGWPNGHNRSTDKNKILLWNWLIIRPRFSHDALPLHRRKEKKILNRILLIGNKFY